MQLTKLKDKVYAIDVPTNCWGCEVVNGDLKYWHYKKDKRAYVDFVELSFEPSSVKRATDLTEGECAGIVEYVWQYDGWENHEAIHKYDDSVFKTAKESLLSLLRSHSLPETSLIIFEK